MPEAQAEEPRSDTHPAEQRSRVKYEGNNKRSRAQNFAPLWELQLQEPAKGTGVVIENTAAGLETVSENPQS